MNPRENLIRWRLVLGSDAEQGLGCGLEGVEARRDRRWGFSTTASTVLAATSASRNPPIVAAARKILSLNVPEWINAVHTLFPAAPSNASRRTPSSVPNSTSMVTNPDLLPAQPTRRCSRPCCTPST